MFGKKDKKQNATQVQNVNRTVNPNVAAPPPVYLQPEQKIFYESEIIRDEDDDELVEIELILDKDTLQAKQNAENRTYDYQQPIIITPVQNVQQPPAEQPVREEYKANVIEENGKDDKHIETTVVKEQNPNNNFYVTTNVVMPSQEPKEIVREIYKTPENKEEPKPEPQPEVRYIVDGPVEDDEIVKPAKLVKLPNLVDYMLSLNMSKRMKMNVATLLLGAYAKYKDIPKEKEILIGCMKKIMYALMNS